MRTGKFIAHAVVPMATTRFTYDGPLIRHFAARTLMVTRSNNVIVDHAKVLNVLSMGEVRLSPFRIQSLWLIMCGFRTTLSISWIRNSTLIF